MILYWKFILQLQRIYYNSMELWAEVKMLNLLDLKKYKKFPIISFYTLLSRLASPTFYISQ